MARPRASSVGAAPEARLLRLVADLTRRFASLLAGAAGPKGPLADAVTFLVSCAEQTAAASESAAGEGEATHPVAGPVPGSIAPIDRLSLALGLAPFELDLALLAGLPEEHEGFADVLRRLHPRGEPRATAALASQLLCADGAQRRLVRQALVAGTPARSGLVRLVEDAPYPERNLVLAEALWPVLQGLDAWPSSVGVDAPPAPAIGLDGWLAAPEVRRARRALELGQPVTLLVLADHDDVGIHRASALVDSVGVPSVRLRLGPDPSHEAERLAQLHAIARGAIPVVRFALPDGPAGSVEAPTFAEFPGPVVLVLRNGTPIAHVRRPLLPLPAELLRPGDRARMWRTVLPELSSEAPSLAS